MTASASFDRLRPALLFGALLLLVVIVERLVTALPAFYQQPLLPAAVAFDLLVGIPLLFYVLIVRRYGITPVSLLGVAAGALALVYWLIPAAQQPSLRVLYYLPAALEGAALALLLVRARRLIRAYRAAYAAQPAIWPSLRAAISTLGLPGRLLLAEMCLLRYALLGWWGRVTVPAGALAFSNHRESGFTALVFTLGMALVVETAAVHLLVGHWSPAAATGLLVLDVYTLVMLVAHAHAVRLSPALLTAGELQLRVGSMWHLPVPRALLVGAEPLRDTPAPDGETLNLTKLLFTAPNLLLTFAEPVEVAGPYGSRRTARRVAVYLDEPRQFAAAAGFTFNSSTR